MSKHKPNKILLHYFVIVCIIYFRMNSENQHSLLSQGDVEIIEMLAGLTEQATSHLSISVGQLTVSLTEGSQDDSLVEQQVELLARLGDATSRIASALGSMMLRDTDTDYVEQTSETTPVSTELEVLQEPDNVDFGVTANKSSLIAETEKLDKTERTVEHTEEAEFDQTKLVLNQKLDDDFELLDIEFELAKLFISGEYLRIEEVKSQIPALAQLDNKSEAYKEFKASYEGYRNRITEYFNRIGLSASWDGQSRRRGRKYNLTIQPVSEKYDSVKTNTFDADDRTITDHKGVIISTPVIRLQRLSETRDEAKTTVKDREAKLFEDRLTDWIIKHAEKAGTSTLKKPELAREIAENIEGVTVAMAKVAISNMVINKKLYKGQSVGGYAMISVEPTELNGTENGNEKKVEKLEFTEELLDISGFIIDFINGERHLELGRSIREIVNQFSNEDFDEKTIKFICRRLCDFGILTEKQNARVGAKKRGRRSNQNVKTTRYMMKDEATRKRWVDDSVGALLEIIEKIECEEISASVQLSSIEAVMDFVDSERQISSGKKKTDIVKSMVEAGLDEREIIASLSALKKAGLLTLIRDARTSKSPHSSNLKVPKYVLKDSDSRDRWRSERQKVLDEILVLISK